jgi:hypothetical protein
MQALRAHLPLVLRVVLALSLVALSWQGGMDRHAQDRVEAQLQRALVAFALARGLNGVISMAQGTEVAVQPAGVGVKLSPGEILDPVNDLVEQFSTVMLLASVSLGVQRLFLAMSAWQPLTLLLALLGLGWAACHLPGARGAGEAWRERLASASQFAFVLLVVMRFAVPLTAVASDAAYRLFLAPEYEETSAALTLSQQQLGSTAESLKPAPPPDAGLLDRARSALESARQAFDESDRLQALQKSASEMARNVVRLIAVFLLETVLFPLAFLAVLVYGTKAALRRLSA